MTIVHTLSELRAAVAGRSPDSLGFVPTMGYLHQGHLSLLEQARRDCGFAVLSIFVNPTQFGPHEDFDRYPRDEARDLALCQAAGADVVWLPAVADLYPDPEHGRTWVTVEGPADLLEGSLRPGHFRGVATVVCKLLNAVGPCRVYLGQKDAQQVAVLQRMLADLFMPHRLVVCDIVREPGGLALSSRNTYLSPEQQAAARALSQGLELARQAWAGGEGDARRLEALVAGHIAATPGLSLQYVQAVDPVSFQPLDQARPGCVIALAVHAGKTRLIDNIILGARP